MRHPHRDYGSAGLVGLCTPQANPTVEAEFRLLMPDTVSPVVTRLTSRADEPRQRLIDYIETLAASLDAFDTLATDVIAFACTGSAYLVGAAREHALVELEQERRGVPVISATAAIDSALRHIGARRIALYAPYPDWLVEAATAYWSARGYQVARRGRVRTQSADTRSIYALGSADARRMLAAEAPAGVDAVVLSGTGMPTLPLVLDHPEFDAAPVLSSNWCLAGSVADALGVTIDLDEVRRRLAAARGPDSGTEV